MVISACPPRRPGGARAARGGRASSSLMTSSRSSSGTASRVAASASRSASSSASSAEALLALGPVGAQVASVARQREVVAVRAVTGEAALEVGVGALRELGRELLRRRPRWTAAGSAARPPRPGRAPRRPRRSARATSSTPAARSSRSAMPWRASSTSQAGSEARDARARADASRAARCAARAPGCRRGACRRAPATSAATSWSRCARRSAGAPLTSSRRSGRNTVTSGRAGDVDQALDRCAVGDRAASARPGWKPTASSWAPVGVARSTSTRAAPAPKRTTSRSFVVRHERPVQPKYSASSRFVLPAPLRPWTTVSPSPSATSARCVAAEVAQAAGG